MAHPRAQHPLSPTVSLIPLWNSVLHNCPSKLFLSTAPSGQNGLFPHLSPFLCLSSHRWLTNHRIRAHTSYVQQVVLPGINVPTHVLIWMTLLPSVPYTPSSTAHSHVRFWGDFSLPQNNMTFQAIRKHFLPLLSHRSVNCSTNQDSFIAFTFLLSLPLQWHINSSQHFLFLLHRHGAPANSTPSLSICPLILLQMCLVYHPDPVES